MLFGALGQFSLGQFADETIANNSVNVHGVAATSAVGTLGPSAASSLTGVAATGAAGNPSIAEAITATGVAATGSAGTITPQVSKTLSGVAATDGVGSVLPSPATPLVGVQGTGGVGVIKTTSTSPTLMGVAAVGAAGALGPNPGANPPGVQGVSAVGNITPLFSGGGGKLPKEEPRARGKRYAEKPSPRLIEVVGEDGLPKKVPLLERFAPPPPPPPLVLAPEGFGKADRVVQPLYELPPPVVPDLEKIERDHQEARDIEDALTALSLIPDPVEDQARTLIRALIADVLEEA